MEQGIYRSIISQTHFIFTILLAYSRNCGVSSKVQKLMQQAMDIVNKKKHGKLATMFESGDWEVKTISSAVKTFLRCLEEPLLTYRLHSSFINSAKISDA